MVAPKDNPNDTANREIVITRVVNAPRELVWDAMTKPEHVVQWWGPNGFTTTNEIMDFRVGGEWKHVMHGPDGTDYPNHKVFKEIERPARIVFTMAGTTKAGTNVCANSTWTFEVVEENKTRVTIRMVFPSSQDRDQIEQEAGAIAGGNQTLARLDQFVSARK